MTKLLLQFGSLGLVVWLAGCLASPVEKSGGPGSITVPNTTPPAILSAAREVFARYGYSPSGGNFPRNIAFERPAGRTGELMFGGFGQTTTIRVQIDLVPLPSSHDIRLMTRVYRVNNAGRAGFESETPMLRVWSSQFNAALREIQMTAANARADQQE